MKKGVKDEDWADLEIFTLKGARIKNPWITITDNGSFLFNSGFVHLSKLRKNTHVILGFSRSNKKIIFQFTSDSKAEGALTIGNRGGCSFTQSRSFFNVYSLKLSDVAGRYIPEKVRIPRIGQVWTINLESKLPEK